MKIFHYLRKDLKSMISRKPIILPLTVLFLLTGCTPAANTDVPPTNSSLNTSQGSDAVVEPGGELTVADRLTSAFEENAALGNVSSIAQGIIDADIFEVSLDVMEVEPGDLLGFNQPIQNFTEGASFSPMIGSIPFMGYIFHTSNPESLVEELESSYDLRWNICTEAEEFVLRVSGDYVMFVMYSESQAKANV